MHPGSLSDLELTRLREDMDTEIGNGTVGQFYRYTGSNTAGNTVAADGTVTQNNAPTVLYDGVCEFATIAARRDRYETRLGEHVFLKQYRVNIPATGVPDILENDRFKVTSSNSDPHLVGREMTVRDVYYNSELAKRQITVVDKEE